MGGFRFNGIGATDHFKKLKSLGVHTCPSCGKETEFFLELAKFKIDIIFIPTVTLKTRYAVMCSKCENGQFVSDAWAAKLLNDGPHDVIFEGAQPTRTSQQENTVVRQPVQGTGGSGSLTGGTAAESTAGKTTAAPAANPLKGAAAPSFFKCPYCGVTQMRDGGFCAYCGKPAPEVQQQAGGQPAPRSKCPACGAQVKPGAVFCDQCGKKIN